MQNMIGIRTVQIKVLIVFVYYVMIGVSLMVVTVLVINTEGIKLMAYVNQLACNQGKYVKKHL